MTATLDTLLIMKTGMKVSSPYITSEFPRLDWRQNWGQPSLSHYVLVIEGSTLRGQLIGEVYPTAPGSGPQAIDTIAELQAELDAWDAAADEDFLAFESQLD